MKILLVFSLLFSFAVKAEITSTVVEAACEAALSPELREQLNQYSQAKNSAQLHQLRAQLIAALEDQLPGVSMDLITEAANHVLNSIMQGADLTGEVRRESGPLPDRSSLKNVDLSNLIKDIASTKDEHSVVIVFKDGDLVCLGMQTHCKRFNETKTLIMKNGGANSVFAKTSDYAVLTDNGNIFCWGQFTIPLTYTTPNEFLQITPGASHFSKVVATDHEFAAITNNGKLFCWTTMKSWSSTWTSNCRNEISNFLKENEDATHFTQVASIYNALAALTDNGKIFCVGDLDLAKECEEKASSFLNDTEGATFFTKIYSNDYAFVALTNNGKLFCLGKHEWGGSCENTTSSIPKHKESSYQIVQVFATASAFGALTDNGELFCWGAPNWGGNCSNINSLISQDDDVIETITSTRGAFLLKTKKGHVYIWGEIGGTKYSNPTKFIGPFLNILSYGYGVLLQKQDLSFTVLGSFDQDILGATSQRILKHALSTEDSP